MVIKRIANIFGEAEKSSRENSLDPVNNEIRRRDQSALLLVEHCINDLESLIDSFPESFASIGNYLYELSCHYRGSKAAQLEDRKSQKRLGSGALRRLSNEDLRNYQCELAKDAVNSILLARYKYPHLEGSINSKLQHCAEQASRCSEQSLKIFEDFQQQIVTALQEGNESKTRQYIGQRKKHQDDASRWRRISNFWESLQSIQLGKSSFFLKESQNSSAGRDLEEQLAALEQGDIDSELQAMRDQISRINSTSKEVFVDAEIVDVELKDLKTQLDNL